MVFNKDIYYQSSLEMIIVCVKGFLKFVMAACVSMGKALNSYLLTHRIKMSAYCLKCK